MHLLITGAWQGARENIGKLQSMGHEIKFMQWEKDSLLCNPEWVEGIIGNGIFLTHPIELFVNLKYIQLTSVGYDRVPVEYVRRKNITIHNARGVYSIPMAEYAIAGVLSLYKQMSFFYDNQKKHLWKKSRGLMELTGKSVLIVGCGSVGIECAKRFKVFGCKIVGVDLHPRENSFFDQIFAFEFLEKEIKIADIIILTLPLNKDTYHLIGDYLIHQMKETAIVVNMSRGAVIDQKALEKALMEKNIYGAVMDVFEEEPLTVDSPLWGIENVIVTPHNSFVGEKNKERLNRIIIDNIRGV